MQHCSYLECPLIHITIVEFLLNKIERTPILKLAMVKRLKVKRNLQKNQNSKK